MANKVQVAKKAPAKKAPAKKAVAKVVQAPKPQGNSKYFLEARNLKKYFNAPAGTVHAVDNLSFGIKKGQTLGIVGESGCGKSTTGRAITRLHKPTAGQVFLGGEEVTSLSDKEYNKEARTKSQFIFQDPLASLNPRMNVKKLVGNPYMINFKKTEYQEYTDAYAAYASVFGGLMEKEPKVAELKEEIATTKKTIAPLKKELVTLYDTKTADFNDNDLDVHMSAIRDKEDEIIGINKSLLNLAKKVETFAAKYAKTNKDFAKAKDVKAAVFAKYNLKEIGRKLKYAEFVERKVIQVLRKVGLQKRVMKLYPHELDGGSRQRVGIARALILNPEFICCDEPTSALDVSVQASVLNTLKELQKAENLTYIFITHDLAVVKHISDDIMVMYLGQAVEKAPADELFKNPQHPYTQALLSAIPSPVPGEKLDPILTEGELTSPIDPEPGCRFAPRCPKAMPACFVEDPAQKEVSKDHFVACYLYDKKAVADGIEANKEETKVLQLQAKELESFKKTAK